MKKNKFLKFPWGIIGAISAMILSFIILVLTVVSIISRAMFANAGGDDGLSEMVIFKILWVLLYILSFVVLASIILFIIRKVIEAKNKENKHGLVRSIPVLISSYVIVWFIVSLVAGPILNSFKATINSALGLSGYRVEEDDSDQDFDSEYFKSQFVKTDSYGNPMYTTDSNGYRHQIYDDEKLRKASVEKADQIQREGTTILWNNDTNGLPLALNSKVSVFSHSSVDWVYSGGGSGNARVTYANNLKTAFTNAKLEVNPTLWNFYASGEGKGYTRTARVKMNEVPWSVYTSAVKDSFSSYGDAAIIVLSRMAGEGSVNQTKNGAPMDVTLTDADTPSKDYYDLSNEERDLIDNVISLKNNGTFKKVIVLLNTPTGMWMEYLMQNQSQIDACLWVSQTGFEGLNEVGRLLVGTSYPSGHLVDTFLYNTQADPAFVNFKAKLYENAKTIGLTNETWQGYYIAYQEGIYVGYKYYETRYEDAVLNQGNATSNVGVKHSSSNWVYKEEVAFPFGFGESFTDFSYSNFDVSYDSNSDEYIVSLTVTNIGSTKGKDAVQIYLQKPFTDFDKENNIEQSSVNLVGYYKTKELSSGSSENISIKIKGELFATYDANVNKTYIREKTNGINAYYLTAAKDAHAAVNNILAAKGKTPSNTANIMDSEGDSSLVKKFEFANDDLTSYSISKETNNPITNQFDDTDWNKYKNKNGDDITYLSRKNWKDTFPLDKPSLSLTSQIVYDLSWDKEVTTNPEDVMPKYNQPKTLSLIDLKGKDFDDPLWDKLLDQMSIDEQIELLGKAYMGTGIVKSISKPKDKAGDGPLGIKVLYPLLSKVYTMSYPTSPLLAATYNDKLAKEMGELQGEDMLHVGVNALYGPGANIHRSTYSGRNYEYYSEDGFLSGMMLKEVVNGIQSKGCYVNVKHIALNDQEDQRYGAGIWANEQSIREIYLEAFKYAAQEGCTGFMSAFNRFGTTWSGAHKGLCTEVLRNEWGFKGFVLSDCAWRKYMGVVDGLMAGNDCILYENTDLTQYQKARTNPTIAQAMRRSVHRILFVTSNCNVMNGLKSGTKVIEVNEWWQTLVINVQIGLGIASGSLLVFTVLCFIFKRRIDNYFQKMREKRKNRKLEEKLNDNQDELLEGDDEDMKLNKFEKFLGIGQKWGASRIIKTSLCVALSLGVIAGSFFLGSVVINANNKTSQVLPVPKEYRFEAECAEITTTIGSKFGIGMESNYTVETANYPSADGYVFGLSHEGEATLVFKIHSEAKAKAQLSIVLGLNTARSLSSIFTYDINGKEIEYDTNYVIPAYTSVQYFDWTKIEIGVLELEKGDNVLTLTKVTSGLNFDYLSLLCGAELEDSRDYANHGHEVNEWNIIETPTVSKEGIITARCKNCGKQMVEIMPKLSVDNGYSEEVIKAPTEKTFGISTFSMKKASKLLAFTGYTYPTSVKEEIYLMEAENTTFTGNASIETNPSLGLSGDSCLKGLAGATWTISFNIKSDVAGEALLFMRLGRRNDREVSLSSGKTITLNDETLEIPTTVVFPQIQSDTKYDNYEEFEIMILNLKEGDNTFVLSNSGSAFTKLDYFRLVSACSLTLSK